MIKPNSNMFRKLAMTGLIAAIAFVSIAAGQAPKAEAATKASRTVSIGDNYLGVPYRFGAKSGITYAFDCSSFTQYVYRKLGVSLPRTSAAQSRRGTHVSRSNLRVGDLVFFSTPASHGKIAHVGIYAGNNRILHTYGSGGVRFSSLKSAHWSSHYITARRVL